MNLSFLSTETTGTDVVSATQDLANNVAEMTDNIGNGRWDLVWSTIVTGLADFGKSAGLRIIGAILVAIFGRLLIKFIIKKIRNGKLFGKIDPTIHGFITSVVNVILTVLLIVSIVAIVGVPMASIVAVIGSVGVAISLAVQGSLANLASGLMLLLFRPFRTGDFIESGAYAGTVTEIGMFYTTLTSPDNKTIVLPNGSLTGASIINYSQQATRRLDINFDVAYGTKVDDVKVAVLRVCGRHPEILEDPAPFVRLTEMKDSSLCMTLRVWVKGADFWSVKFDLLEEVYAEFATDNISIPFPQLDVHLDK